MALTSWGARAAGEPQDRTEARVAGTGPNDNLRAENGKLLSSADNGVAWLPLATFRKNYKKNP